MQKINAALERLSQAAQGISTLNDAMASRDTAMREAQIETAHLRAEISSLKKQNQQLQADCKRAARRVEKAIEKIDNVLAPDADVAPAILQLAPESETH